MATKTSLLGLTKPAYTDAADVNVLNTNFDLIDKAVGNGARVYNLLDNSWFVKPINQRGIASGATVGAYKYCIDRWENYSNTANTLTFNDNGIVFQFNLCQFLNSDTVKAGMVVTAAAKWADGTIQVANGTITKGSSWTWFHSGTNNGRMIGVVDHNGTNYVRIDNDNGDTLVWAALYEGAYTAETLPAYQYKGYVTELAECQRYYQTAYRIYGSNAGGVARESIVLRPAMRVAPTVSVVHSWEGNAESGHSVLDATADYVDMSYAGWGNVRFGFSADL